jgi:hypothetical protein
MKFKITSVLELIVPASIAVMLLAFLGCGGGGNYGKGTSAYDGNWSLNLKGYALPGKDPAATGEVSCSEDPTLIVIAHGQGTTTEYLTCTNSVSPIGRLDIGVTLYPDPAASGITGTVRAVTNGTGTVNVGICIDRVSCKSDNLLMIKCGEAGASFPGSPCP